MKGRGKAPAFQWYPGDHRRDTAVQACTFEARALWRDMLDLMHDGEPYGHLTAGGVPITEDELARMLGAPLASVRRWLRELEERKVFSRTDAGVIYSRRMVRDEHIRQVRAKAGTKGGNPALLMYRNGSDLDKQRDNHRPNQSREQKPTPASAVASATATTPPPPAGACGREAFLASLPAGQNRQRWEAQLAAWRQGMNIQHAVTDAALDQGLSEYLLVPGPRDYSPAHVRRFVERADRELRPPATGSMGAMRSSRGRRPPPQQFTYSTDGNAAALAELGVQLAEAAS